MARRIGKRTVEFENYPVIRGNNWYQFINHSNINSCQR